MGVVVLARVAGLFARGDRGSLAEALLDRLANGGRVVSADVGAFGS